MFVLYNLLLLLLSPLIAVYYIWRVVGNGKSRGAWRQQMGCLPQSLRKRSGRPRVWIHAVSVGEAVASGPVLRELKKLMPDVEIVVSTTTTTGQQMAKKSLKEADYVIYFPLDLLPFVRRSIASVKPDVYVCMESEIWPNFLFQVRRRGVPALMVNGIVSDKTVKTGKRLRFIYKWALDNIQCLLMQTKLDADRIVSLGASPERVEVVGNCKFDQESDVLNPEQVEEIRSRYSFSSGQRAFIAGSTNPGEDEPVLTAFKIARKAHPDLKLIIAPRQIERAETIAEMAQAFGFTCGFRGKNESLTGSEDVVVLDIFGELAAVYSIGDVAFVGGSLIEKGGHNILQPIAQGKPVFFGPYTFKARDLVRQAKAAEVGFEIGSGEEMGERISSLLSDADELERIRVRALEMISVNRGASRRCAEAIVSAVNRAK